MSLHCLMHMMYPLAREGRREEECSLCPRRAAACFLLSSDRESAFAIRLSLFLDSLAFSTLLHSPYLSFMEVILASIRKEAGPGYIVLCLSDIVTCDVQLV